MKPSTKAALLSGFAFPGTGQIHLKRLRRGITIMVCVLSGIGALVWMATVRVMAALDQLQNQMNKVDTETISNLAISSSADTSSCYNIIVLFIVCCWIFSIVDAYRIGRRIEHLENHQGVRGETPWQR